MKKKTIANLIMALIAAAVVVGGVTIAMNFRESEDTGLGSAYRLANPPKLELVNENAENTCTVTILCDTILSNLETLEEAKLPYVPVDGVILPVTQVSFDAGETAFQVMQRVCQAYELQIEYSWTPAYDSYYIESINHIYEFDCGPESGWMYRVNGVFPNYGCSEYKLSDGDEMVWCYTSNGLGADVGKIIDDEG